MLIDASYFELMGFVLIELRLMFDSVFVLRVGIFHRKLSEVDFFSKNLFN